MSAVDATLEFFAGSDGPPVYIASQGGRDAGLDVSGRFEDRTVRIHDARAADETFELDVQGFTRAGGLNPVPDFRSANDVDGAYVDHVAALVSHYTGAARVEVFDHTLRAVDPDVRGSRQAREPTALLHNDYTDRSAPQRVRDLYPDEAEMLLRRRFAIVNVWRPINHAVQTKPLAVCDARSLDPGDLVPCERRARDRIGELMLVKYNAGQRWYYFPELQTDEALLIKTFDSARDGRARFSAHTAFDLPTTATDARPRHSIETRAFAFF